MTTQPKLVSRADYARRRLVAEPCHPVGEAGGCDVGVDRRQVLVDVARQTGITSTDPAAVPAGEVRPRAGEALGSPPGVDKLPGQDHQAGTVLTRLRVAEGPEQARRVGLRQLWPPAPSGEQDQTGASGST